MKNELNCTDAEAPQSAVEVGVKKKESGALDAVMAKYDGRRRTSMAYGLASDVLTQKAGKNAYKGVAIAAFLLLILAIAAVFGVSFAAGEMLKDTEATNSTLATRDGRCSRRRRRRTLCRCSSRRPRAGAARTDADDHAVVPRPGQQRHEGAGGARPHGRREGIRHARLLRCRLQVGRGGRAPGRRRVQPPLRCRLGLRRSAAPPPRPPARRPVHGPHALPSPGGTKRAVCEADVTCSAPPVRLSRTTKMS